MPQTTTNGQRYSRSRPTPRPIGRTLPFLVLVGLTSLVPACSCSGASSAACPECPTTCNDGVMNGDEEQLDCGGSCLGCDGTLPATLSPVREYAARFAMAVERDGCTTLHRPHSQRRWSVFPAGRCAGCGIPSRISSAAFDDTLIVSWAASAAYTGIEEPGGRRYGHLSTFTFTEEDGFTKVNDFAYDGCTFDMGSVAVSPDGSVIGALCLAHKVTDDDGRKNLYLYEWTGGEITQTPETIALLSTSAGGWNYGHWDLSLNNDLTHYFVEVKATGGGHETELHFAVDRMNGHTRVDGEWTDGSNCGGGHTTSNRITHNAHDDTWSVFCQLDSGQAMRWHPVPEQDYRPAADVPHMQIEAGRRAPIVTVGLFSTPGDISDRPGGVANLISLGSRGWMVAALGPFDIWDGTATRDERLPLLVDQQIGVRRLPLTIQELVENEGDYPWHWIPRRDVCEPVKGREPRAGMVQLHNWGLGGEDSGRILLGYTPGMQHPGRTNEYHVVEIDEDGRFLHDPVLLQRGGWGVDSLGTHMPGSGCIVFPHTWLSDDSTDGPTASYPPHEEPAESRSQYLKLTALCPTDNVPRRSGGACQVRRSLVSETPAETPPVVSSECPLPSGL